jgi:hypothetical protein
MTWRETTKLTPSLGLTWKGTNKKKIYGVKRNFFFKPGQFDRYCPFMASPGPECTCTEPEKLRVWPNGDSCRRRRNSAGKVTGRARFAIRAGADIIQNLKIVVLF